MPAADTDGHALNWPWIIRRRPVVLSSPHPVGECLQRLATVTTSRRATSWYLDPRTVGHPDPLFLGQAGQSRIRVARWRTGSGRGSFVAMLDARPGPSA